MDDNDVRGIVGRLRHRGTIAAQFLNRFYNEIRPDITKGNCRFYGKRTGILESVNQISKPGQRALATAGLPRL